MRKKFCFKKICACLLCIIMCLGLCTGVFAQDYTAVDKLNVEEISYYIVTGEDADETETLVTEFTQTGKYRVKADVKNYDDVNSVNAFLVAGLFVKDTHELKAVEFDKLSVAKGETATLRSDIVVTDISTPVEIKGYVIKSLSSLVPQGNEAPTAPQNVVIDTDKITNSTVELSWDSSYDDAKAVAYYNVYRNGKYVGSTFGDETTFKDVGIEHNTEVSYTVEAVDAVGAISEKSEVTDEAKCITDDIARLWFGAAIKNAADGTVITDQNVMQLLGDEGAYNIRVVDTFSNETITNGDYGEFNTSILVKSGESTYLGNENKKAGLDCFDFAVGNSRVQTVLDESFVNYIKDEKEINLILSYYDSTAIGPADSTLGSISGGTPYAIVKYSCDGMEGLSGSTGGLLADGHTWKTAVNKIPTKNLTDGEITANGGYPSVLSNRKFDFSEKTRTGVRFADTDGKSVMFSLGSGNKSHDTKLHNVLIHKMEIAKGDYVPYGAVLDFDKQQDTQFIEFLRRDGFNWGNVDTVNNKKAIGLYQNSKGYLKVGLSKNYITATDNNLIFRITYFDSSDCSGKKLTLKYPNSSGGTTSKEIATCTGTGEWINEEIILNDAAFTDNFRSSLIVETDAISTNPIYVSRVEVIKR